MFIHSKRDPRFLTRRKDTYVRAGGKSVQILKVYTGIYTRTALVEAFSCPDILGITCEQKSSCKKRTKRRHEIKQKTHDKL